ncbi:MAG: hypothetical protein HY903_08020 [Deltaproteobacteria bacterium]|nr:hypothetical protein [Deltaproteobacteria bacterium]
MNPSPLPAVALCPPSTAAARGCAPARSGPRAALGIVGGLVTLVGCQDYSFLYRPHQRVATTQVHEIVMRNSDTDILFVIDNSGSMQEEQDNVIRNTRLFIDELALSENAYRVGIVTTDAIDEKHPGEDGGRLRMVRANQTRLNNAGCGIGPDTSPLPYLVRPNLDDPQADAKRCRLVQDFTATVQSLGTGGSGRESGMLSARKALDSRLATIAAHNAGFLRDGADLALIFLSDEEDCAFEDYGTGDWPNAQCYEDTAHAIPPASLLDFFANLKSVDSGVRKVRAALIAGGIKSGESGSDFTPRGCVLEPAGPSAACGCWSSTDDSFFCTYLNGFGQPCSSTAGCGGSPGDRCAAAPGGLCDTPRCEALPAVRYHGFMAELRRRRLAVGFSRGTYEDSICQNEYDQTLLTIARTVVLSSCFSLETPITDPDTVRLIVRPVGSTDADTLVPRYSPDAADTGAVCHDCGLCAGGGWQLMDPKTICLQCGLKKQTGDEFLLTAITEMVGFDDGGKP